MSWLRQRLRRVLSLLRASVMKRPLRPVLSDPKLRRVLFVGLIVTIQAREGIVTTREQAERAYDLAREGKIR